ncbi:MAG: hypothetical protein HY892_07905, partial [Deltaproteobacteria bacterium]|nr:hypothetical protein [Deltaproteobacteria bacterium]
MTAAALQGSYHLKPGVRLQETPAGGVVIQPNPLRLLKINRSAWELLKQCEQGFPLDQNPDLAARPAVLDFLDQRRQEGLLDWSPPETPGQPVI